MKIFLLTAAIFCISLLQAQGKQILGAQTQRDSILASVNGESITLQDVMLETNADEAKLASLYNGEDLVRKIEEILSSLKILKIIYFAVIKRIIRINNLLTLTF